MIGKCNVFINYFSGNGQAKFLADLEKASKSMPIFGDRSA
jgi:hypothetical protein